ncbi:dihydrofolate reductase family protein [Mesorhizobium hawassense]|uniref:dihydrofolate reductase family protein n=1 Tax=Mesorhizobium hawassense TaxID=1209954 RepID=UPI003CCB37BB
MRKLIVFNSISLDGYFTDGHGGMDWVHSQDPEWNAFVADNAKGGGMLVLGRVTYDLMIQFWPTPLAAQIAPVVAERMNAMPKVVFSRTLDTASWKNTELVKSGAAAKLRHLKQRPGNHMTILGSGNLVAQLGRGEPDRRIPVRHRSGHAWRRQDDVRGHRQPAQCEAGPVTGLRQRQRLPALRAEGAGRLMHPRGPDDVQPTSS